jgi:glutamine amidotransferase
MIAIVDYGLGNIRAFANLYKRLNIEHLIADKPEHLEKADKIILPGVGAFDYAMTLLNRSGLRQVLEEMVLGKQTPVLGICVGMQIMAASSEEGVLEGLNWIPARVLKFPDNVQPLPHMGWNNIVIEQQDPILSGLDQTSRFYFLHSYYFKCDKESSLASTSYTINFTSIARRGNVYGVQFHPEKSHGSGITILKNFALI